MMVVLMVMLVDVIVGNNNLWFVALSLDQIVETVLSNNGKMKWFREKKEKK